MSLLENYLIEAENESLRSDCITVLDIDDHIMHLKSHIKFIWKLHVFTHCLKHITAYVRQKKNRTPSITLDEVLRGK